MNDTLSPLSDEEVRQVAALVESLENSTFDFLQLQIGDLKLTLGKGEPPSAAGVAAPAAAAPVAAPAPAPAAPAAAPAPAPAAAPAEDGTVAIVAPLMGRFYAQSEPGADPFVTIGAEITEETTVALIEVMKMYTTVPAGLRGVITEICVGNEEIIEYGQVLFRVRPTA